MTNPLDHEEELEEIIEDEEDHLTPEESNQFINLLQVGKVSKEIDVLGHSIIIRTLDTGEELALGLMLKEYENSPAYTRAFKAAIVSAIIEEIDGKPFYQSLGPEAFSVALSLRFNKIKEYHPAVIDLIYGLYGEFEKSTVSPILSRLGKN